VRHPERSQVQDVVSRIERDLGPVDICVNNAAHLHGGAAQGHEAKTGLNLA